MKKRVCIVRHNYYPDEAHVRRDAEALLQHGYEVDVICLKGEDQPRQESVRGVNVHRLPVAHQRKGILRYMFEYLVFFLLASWRLTRLYFRRRYDVIEVDNMPDFLVFTAIVPKLFGAKIILYVFDNMPEVFIDGYGLSPGHIVVRLLRIEEKISAVWADHVIATQSDSTTLLTNMGIRDSKISVVLNVPDEDVFMSGPVAGGDNGSFVLITHGSIVERYNIQSLIRTVPLLVKDIPELQVEVVGGGEYKDQLERLTEELGVKEYVHFTGLLPFEEVCSHIARAHVGVAVIPSGANPAVPNKLFEYLAMGKPAIVTTVPTIEAYFDGETVMYYEPDNERDLARCVLELYRSPEKRAKLAEMGLSAYQKYHWPVTKHEYLRVFDRIIEDRKSSSSGLKGKE